jgi:hypothetical protein
MLQLRNATPFKAMILPLQNVEGVDTVFTVVKATFSLGDRIGLAEEQVPVSLADKHYGDPVASSVRIPSDVSLGKPGTDVLLIGSAWAPGGRPTWQMDVSVVVGQVGATVRVFGDRVWDAGHAGATMSWVTPFTRMPLVWERAFGGTDETDRGPVTEPRNPVGVGFRSPRGTKPLAGMPLPNVEDPSALISTWKDTPTPAGFAPLAPHWEARRVHAGTYDDAWKQSRAPFLPTDFDPRFFQLAPRPLVASGYLRGGEPVDVRGATPAGVLRFELPAMTPQTTYRLDRGSERRPTVLESVILEPDAERLVMVWRSAFPCDKRMLRLKEVHVALQ